MASTSSTGVEGSRRLFVGNLPPYARYKDLLKAFLQDGAKAAHVIKHGKMRIGYVTFDTADAANAALARLPPEGLTLYKRKLVVKKADPWQDAKVARAPNPEDQGLRTRPSSDRPGLALPSEIVGRICRYLPYKDRARMECVSRAWRLGSRMSHLGTTRLDTGDTRWAHGWGDSLISSEGFYWLVQRAAPTIKTAKLCEEHCGLALRSCILSVTAKACKDLEMVDLGALTSRPSGLRELAECTTALHTLVLGRSWGAVDGELYHLLVRNPGLQNIEFRRFGLKGGALAALTPHLKTMVVELCPRLNADHLAIYLGRAEKLEDLRILNGLSLEGEGVLTSLATNPALRTSLRTLMIFATDFRPRAQPQVEDPDVEVENEGEADWDDQAPELPLDFERAQFFELDRLEYQPTSGLPSNLTAVRSLSLTALAWVDSLLVQEIANHMSGIEELDLSLCSNIRGEGALDPLTQLPHLRKLRLNHLHPELTGESIATLSGLEEFEARGWQGLGTEPVCGLLRVASALRLLDVENCRQLTRPVVRVAIEVTRNVARTVRLELCVGGTRIVRCKKDRRNQMLYIHYERRLKYTM